MVLLFCRITVIHNMPSVPVTLIVSCRLFFLNLFLEAANSQFVHKSLTDSGGFWLNIPSESVKINFVYSDSAVFAVIRGTRYVLIDACAAGGQEHETV